MRLNRTEQALEMVDSLLLHCDSLEAAACRNIGRSNESVLIKKWDPKLMAWFGYENANNLANIWVRPSPDQLHPWFLIDDLPLVLALKLNRKYQCVVVETSQGNCQVRLLANVSLSKEHRKVVQVELVKLLGSNADVGSTAGCKWGRLPGFRNRKPDRDAWTNLVATPDPTLPKFDSSPYINNISTTKVVVRVSASSNSRSERNGGIDQSANEFGRIFGRLKFYKETGRDYFAEAEKLKLKLILNTHKRNPDYYAEITINSVLKRL